jgi:hypothetical protein
MLLQLLKDIQLFMAFYNMVTLRYNIENPSPLKEYFFSSIPKNQKMRRHLLNYTNVRQNNRSSFEHVLFKYARKERLYISIFYRLVSSIRSMNCYARVEDMT